MVLGTSLLPAFEEFFDEISRYYDMYCLLSYWGLDMDGLVVRVNIDGMPQ